MSKAAQSVTMQCTDGKISSGPFQCAKGSHGFYIHGSYRRISPPMDEGHRYALTVICMLTGFTWCISIKDKKAPMIIKAYMNEVYYKYGGSRKILSDNGSEFKNDLFTLVANKLGVEHKIFSPLFILNPMEE